MFGRRAIYTKVAPRNSGVEETVLCGLWRLKHSSVPWSKSTELNTTKSGSYFVIKKKIKDEGKDRMKTMTDESNCITYEPRSHIEEDVTNFGKSRVLTRYCKRGPQELCISPGIYLVDLLMPGLGQGKKQDEFRASCDARK